MSTESETKSAGVPAGATHVCIPHGSYWRQASSEMFERVGKVMCPRDCSAVPTPIAEAGPAPTTAAPVEQLSGKVVEGQPPRECAFCDTTEVNGVNINECSSCLTLCCTAHSEDADNQRVLCINCAPEDEPVPAEQPGKAADPRPAQPQAPVQTYQADAPEHLTISSAFGSVQPQAPAEPTQEQLDAADAWCESLPGQGDLVELLAQYAEHVAAPLREERDRLARELAGALEDAAKGRMCDVEQHASRIHYGTEDNERLRTDLMAERAKVAERDARIATLTARAEGALALAETYRKAWRAALGAPEGQPRDYDPMTSPVPEGDMNGPHGPIPAPEGQPPVASSEAPPDALRRLAAKWDQEASEAADVNRLATLRLCARELRAALSAPPPPPREQEQLGEEGDLLRLLGEARSYIGYGATFEQNDLCERIDAVLTAPPRKAPRWRSPRCDYSLRTLLQVALDHVALESHLLRADMRDAIEVFAPAPSSPEEQLSGKELK